MVKLFCEFVIYTTTLSTHSVKLTWVKGHVGLDW